MRGKASVLVLLTFLVIGGVLVFLRNGPTPASTPDTSSSPAASQPRTASGGTLGAAGTPRSGTPEGASPAVSISLLYSTEKEEWLKSAVAGFQKEQPRISVTLEPEGSLDAVRSLLSGEKTPTLWAPADRLADNLLTTQWQLTKGEDPLVREPGRWPRSLLLTPLVFVVWQSRGSVLLGSSTELKWQRLRDAVSKREGWKGLGGDPAWGYVKLGHTDPARSNSGLQALTLMAYGFYDRLGHLGVPEVTAPLFQDFVKGLEAGRQRQDYGAASTGTFMQNFIRQGPSLYDVAVVYEALAISELPRAEGRWEPLRVYYPNINLWNDHPLCLLKQSWVTPAQTEAAGLLAEYLMSKAVQEDALIRGYRPGNLDVSVRTADPKNPFNRYKSVGIRVDIPRVAEAPDGAVLQALLQTFQRNTNSL